MLKGKKTNSAIADTIGVNKSTISRKLKRNSRDGKHHYTTAQELWKIREERLLEPRKFNDEIKNRIDRKMREKDWSPVQIDGWSKRHRYAMVGKGIEERPAEADGTRFGDWGPLLLVA